MSISSRVTDARQTMRRGVIGALVFAGLGSHGQKTLLNYASQSVQIDTVVINNAINNTVYSVDLDGVTVSVTSDATATKIEIADALAIAMNAEPLVRGRADSVSNGIDTITVTGLHPGDDGAFVLTDSDPNLTTASVTSSGDADEVEPGRVMVSFENTDDGEESGVLAASTAFVAQVDTVTPSGYVASSEVYVTVEIEGWIKLTGSHVMATSLAASMTALAAVLNDILPANSVVAVGTATAITLTSELGGIDFTSSAGVNTGGASNPTMTIVSTKSVTTSLLMSFSGVSMRDGTVSRNDDGINVWKATDAIAVLDRGDIWIEEDTGSSILKNGACFLEMNNGDENGRLYPVKTATRIALPFRLARFSRSGGDGIAAVRITVD